MGPGPSVKDQESSLSHVDEVDVCCALVGSKVEGERREKLASLLDFQVDRIRTTIIKKINIFLLLFCTFMLTQQLSGIISSLPEVIYAGGTCPPDTARLKCDIGTPLELLPQPRLNQIFHAAQKHCGMLAPLISPTRKNAKTKRRYVSDVVVPFQLAYQNTKHVMYNKKKVCF